MRSREQLARALQDELACGDERDQKLAQDMAFAATSAALIMGCNALVPVAGGIAAAATVPLLNRWREQLEGGEMPKDHVFHELERECAARKLGEDAERREWESWLPWDELRAGQKVPVPASLPHPRDAGFRYTHWSKDVGQIADWVYSLPDGCRLHVHELMDGSLIVHCDRFDPANGPATASVHWLAETPEGNVVAAALVVGALGLAWRLVES